MESISSAIIAVGLCNVHDGSILSGTKPSLLVVKENWTNNIDDWQASFEHGDVVIGRGWDHFKTMFSVHEIDLESNLEHVTHRGLFWDKIEARMYAYTLIGR